MARPRQLDKTQQFLAILRKNFVLQTRGRKSFLGIGGWAGLILQLLLPVAFFFVMYLPKHYIKPTHHSETLGPASIRLESRSWADPYDGPATFPSHGGRARLILTPDTPDVRGLAHVLARGLACPRDPALRGCPVPNLPTNFHCLFMPPPPPLPPPLLRFGGAHASESMHAEVLLGESRDADVETAMFLDEKGAGEVWEQADLLYNRGAGSLLPRWWQQRHQARHAELDRGGGGGGGWLRAAPNSRVVETATGEATQATNEGPLAADPCADFATCVSTPACYEHVLRNQISFAASQEAARQAVLSDPDRVDAVVHFPGAAGAGTGGGAAAGAAEGLPVSLPVSLLGRTVVGMNHSDVPPTGLLLDLFEVVPTRGNGLALYRRYWFFSNLQLAINRAVIGIHVAASTTSTTSNITTSNITTSTSDSDVSPRAQGSLGAGDTPADDGRLYGGSVGSPYDVALPAQVEVSYKPFPWPAVTEDLGAASAAIFFNLLLVYAFLPPTRAVVGDIVREKELRLREGMRVLGLSEPSYWMSWGLTHWLLLALSGALCAAAGTYPFASSSAWLMLAFFWLYGAALVSYSYCLSTLFSSSRVAGTATQLLYAVSMLPGFVLPAIYQYGSWTWYAACLSPPSAASLFAAALVNWEKVAEGITLHTLWLPITQANNFSAATVFYFLAADVVLYGILTWYLDKVLPKSYGQRLPWWFVFDRRYWSARRQSGGGRREGGGGGGGGGGDRNRSGAVGLWGWTATWRWRKGMPPADERLQLDGPLIETASGPGSSHSHSGSSTPDRGGGGGAGSTASSGAAVEVRGLVKTFRSLTGPDKVAVDHLDMKIDRGRITALLGHNGAGKTTTIHVLTGMLQPTAGSASVNGFDVATQMDQVRASLGICPQFDILWPDLSVAEHLGLYGAIKGYRGRELREVAVAAAASVGLSPKLHAAAGELSGGQRRKLSVAIAFLGDPAVVFLDEPTSGMDPYSKRFTWDVIRRHRANSAVVLTTHSMEEADLLGDRVVILARGRVAAEGTAMELKAAHGVGYNLTLVIDPRQQQQQQRQGQRPPASQSPSPRQSDSGAGGKRVTPKSSGDGTGGGGGDGSAAGPLPGAATATTTTAVTASPSRAAPQPSTEAATAVMAVVRQHVPSAELLSAAGAEVVVRLPREAAGSFPALLRELDGPVGRSQLGVASYGLSLTTLEEVFLTITAAVDQQAADSDASTTGSQPPNPSPASATPNSSSTSPTTTTPPPAAPPSSSPQRQTPPPPPPSPSPPPLPPPLRGWRLYGQQLRALLSKRALCARRDRLAVVTQLAVPLALVYLALWISDLQIREPSEPPLELNRATALLGRPLVLSAAPGARNATGGCGGGGGGDGVAACLAAFMRGHPGGRAAVDSGATSLFTGDPRVRPSTLEAFLLSRWYGSGAPFYDALHVTSLPSPAALIAAATAPPPSSTVPPSPVLSFVLLTNQSAVSSLPAALSDAMTAALSYISAALTAPPPPVPAAVSSPSPGSSAVTAPSPPTAAVRQSMSSSSSSSSSPSPLPQSVFSSVSWPLPTLASEPVVRVQRDAASLMLVLCLVLASSVLSASFVVFLVREQDNNSKHLQLVSGAPATAYWLANYLWDLLSYSLSAAGLLALMAAYRLPQYSGARLAASAGLLWGFGPAGISLTYLLHFLFRDEMRALQRLNTAYFLTGYLGFVVTWICDLIEMLVPRPGALHAWNAGAKWALRTASPHYCFARGMYDVQSTYDTGFPFMKRHKPFDWDVYGSPMVHMAAQTLVYGGLAVLYDSGIFTVAYARLQDAAMAAVALMRGSLRLGRGRRHPRAGRQGSGGTDDAEGERLLALEQGQLRTRGTEAATPHGGGADDADGNGSPVLAGIRGGGGDPHPSVDGGGGGDHLDDHGDVDEDENEDEDVDVAEEHWAVVRGYRNDCQVLLDGVRKSYGQGLFRPPVAAVRGLWVGVPAGECFGLLGVNGAGKTTTFRMLTGEVLPDGGDALVGGCSVRTRLAAARQQLGYCPQFEALPGAMTGREVAAMYARLRGVPEPHVGPLVAHLLRRLGLQAAADSPCGGYSGGMKRKLGVAVALVGDPRVCALDEPSTGMDPGARRGLWSCLQNEVIRAGRTVVLTSHSMEECEALCSRLTIMAEGRLRCLGTVQHLKGRFGGGYVLEIKTLPRSPSAASLAGATSVTPAASTAEAACPAAADSLPGVMMVADSETASRLAAWVASVCPGASLMQADQNRFTFSIPRVPGGIAGTGPCSSPATSPATSPSSDLAALFEAVETRRVDLGVVDYCLTQTTLEQVFVAMAQGAAAHDHH